MLPRLTIQMADKRIPELAPHIRSAEVVLPCADLAASLAFFTETLGFRIEMIFPADAPSTAVVSGYGVNVRLELRAPDAQTASIPALRLFCDQLELTRSAAGTLHGPGGIRVELVDEASSFDLPQGTQEFVLSRGGDERAWGVGRAGMQYRDLIPGRLGGRFVASHIRILDGGDVPDYVHYHKIRFQMIYCKTGWVRVVYEDQGAPFLLQAGDCVLQPPEIRHRVLEASAGAEVIEIGCPAIHATFADHALQLPTLEVRPERLFGAQRFVRHVAADANWSPSHGPGFETRDTGIAAATAGLGCVRVIRPRVTSAPDSPIPGGDWAADAIHSGEFLFLFVLGGALLLQCEPFGRHALHADDSVVIPAGTHFKLQAGEGLELLEVRMPALNRGAIPLPLTAASTVTGH